MVKFGSMTLADMLPISDNCCVESSLYSSESEREVFGTMMMYVVSIASEGEQLFPSDDDGNRTLMAACQLVIPLVEYMRELVLFQTLFLLQLQLKGELPVDVVAN
jgi:hypothetical protein